MCVREDGTRQTITVRADECQSLTLTGIVDLVSEEPSEKLVQEFESSAFSQQVAQDTTETLRQSANPLINKKDFHLRWIRSASAFDVG